MTYHRNAIAFVRFSFFKTKKLCVTLHEFTLYNYFALDTNHSLKDGPTTLHYLAFDCTPAMGVGIDGFKIVI